MLWLLVIVKRFWTEGFDAALFSLFRVDLRWRDLGFFDVFRSKVLHNFRCIVDAGLC
jgi:hypothetical protein